MIKIHEQYLVDEYGNRKVVVAPIAAWQEILEAIEELDDIRAYDEAKGRPSEAIPFEQGVLGLRDYSCR